jgi:membrane protein
MAHIPGIEHKRRAGGIFRSIWDWLNRIHATIERTWLVRGYRLAEAGDVATVIAFNALVALVPTVLLMAAITGMFLRQEQVLKTATMTSVWALPPSAARDALDGLLRVRRESTLLGVISIFSFAWIGTTFVGAIARGMNRIYGVPNRRFVHDRIRGFAVVVTFAALFGTAAIAAAAPTLFVGKGVGVYFQSWRLATWHGQALSYGVAMMVALLLFTLLHRVIPNARQRAKDIWPGTIAGAFLFVLITQAFPVYLRLLGGGNRYGAVFGLIWLLVTWFYLLAHVLLFSTYINATYMRHRRRSRRERERFFGPERVTKSE